jgi:hypothetical protein
MVVTNEIALNVLVMVVHSQTFDIVISMTQLKVDYGNRSQMTALKPGSTINKKPITARLISNVFRSKNDVMDEKTVRMDKMRKTARARNALCIHTM